MGSVLLMDETTATLTVVTPRGAMRRVVRVEVDGKVVGYLAARTEGRQRWWGSHLTDATTFDMTLLPRMTYGVRERAQALDNLLFNARRAR